MRNSSRPQLADISLQSTVTEKNSNISLFRKGIFIHPFKQEYTKSVSDLEMLVNCAVNHWDDETNVDKCLFVFGFILFCLYMTNHYTPWSHFKSDFNKEYTDVNLREMGKGGLNNTLILLSYCIYKTFRGNCILCFLYFEAAL